MNKLIFTIIVISAIIVLIDILVVSAFAQSDTEAISTPIESFFDYISDTITANLGDPTNPKTKATIDIVETGNEGGKRILGLWLWLHEALIDMMLYISGLLGVGFNKGVALLISFALGTGIIAFALWKFFKHFWKFALVIGVVIAIVWILPLENLALGN